MSISPFFSPLHFGDYDVFLGIIDPIDDSIITNTDAIERFKQFFATRRARGFFEGLNCFGNGGVISAWNFIELPGHPFRKLNLIQFSPSCGRHICQRR